MKGYRGYSRYRRPRCLTVDRRSDRRHYCSLLVIRGGSWRATVAFTVRIVQLAVAVARTGDIADTKISNNTEVIQCRMMGINRRLFLECDSISAVAVSTEIVSIALVTLQCQLLRWYDIVGYQTWARQCLYCDSGNRSIAPATVRYQLLIRVGIIQLNIRPGRL